MPVKVKVGCAGGGRGGIDRVTSHGIVTTRTE